MINTLRIHGGGVNSVSIPVLALSDQDVDFVVEAMNGDVTQYIRADPFEFLFLIVHNGNDSAIFNILDDDNLDLSVVIAIKCNCDSYNFLLTSIFLACKYVAAYSGGKNSVLLVNSTHIDLRQTDLPLDTNPAAGAPENVNLTSRVERILDTVSPVFLRPDERILDEAIGQRIGASELRSMRVSVGHLDF